MQVFPIGNALTLLLDSQGITSSSVYEEWHQSSCIEGAAISASLLAQWLDPLTWDAVEELVVRRPVTRTLTQVEMQVIAQIRALRASPEQELHTALIENPAQIMYHFLTATHGHVQLHLAPIARELGADMRKLQRDFLKMFKRSMLECQLEARLNYAKYHLRIFPDMKISALAAKLGYVEVRDFNHFFQKHVQQTPSEWSRGVQAKLEDTNIDGTADDETK